MTTKLMIPALLLGVVMIAGIFAFMPVQEASTVHTSTGTTENSIRYFTVVATCNVSNGVTDDCEDLNIDVATDATYRVLSGQLTTQEVGGQTTLDAQFTACTAGGADTTSTLIVLDSGDAAGGNDTDIVHDTAGLPAEWFFGTAVLDDIRCDAGTNLTTNGDIITIKILLEINADAADPTVNKFDAT